MNSKFSIKESLNNDKDDARKLGDKSALSTILMIIDSVQKREKALLRDATEDELVDVITSFKKLRTEERDGFAKAGYADRVIELDDAIALTMTYLPKQMTRKEIEVLVDEVIAKLSAVISKLTLIDKGTIMKEIVPLVKGKADNKIVGEIVASKVGAKT